MKMKMKLFYEWGQDFVFTQINSNTKWKRNGIIVAGGNGQ